MMGALMAVGGLLVIVSAVMAAYGFKGREQVVGIDLGTTFSVVAIKRNKDVTIIPDFVSERTLTPSVVHFFSNGSVVVGDKAVALRNDYASRTIFNAKRFIGKNMSDVAADAAAHPYSVVGNRSADPSTALSELAAGFAIPGEGAAERWLSPVDVGAEVVAHMKRSIAHSLGYEIKRAVICVPAKFSWRESKATQEAFEKAGFKVQRILEEPTAAAVAYNLHQLGGAKHRHVLVYDIGGGTLDTSLLYMNGRSISVLGVAGDDHLGGSDFDQAMQRVLEGKLPGAEVAERGETATVSCDRTGLNLAAERAKIALTSEQSVEVRCRDSQGHTRRTVVSRAEFESACQELYDRALAPVEQVLEDQYMTSANVDDVVLVGGASRMPRLRQLLQEYMGPDKKLHTEIDPDITVAYGAANILD